MLYYARAVLDWRGVVLLVTPLHRLVLLKTLTGLRPYQIAGYGWGVTHVDRCIQELKTDVVQGGSAVAQCLDELPYDRKVQVRETGKRVVGRITSLQRCAFAYALEYFDELEPPVGHGRNYASQNKKLLASLITQARVWGLPWSAIAIIYGGSPGMALNYWRRHKDPKYQDASLYEISLYYADRVMEDDERVWLTSIVADFDFGQETSAILCKTPQAFFEWCLEDYRLGTIKEIAKLRSVSGRTVERFLHRLAAQIGVPAELSLLTLLFYVKHGRSGRPNGS